MGTHIARGIEFYKVKVTFYLTASIKLSATLLGPYIPFSWRFS